MIKFKPLEWTASWPLRADAGPEAQYIIYSGFPGNKVKLVLPGHRYPNGLLYNNPLEAKAAAQSHWEQFLRKHIESDVDSADDFANTYSAGQWVEKYTGEARWKGRIITQYRTGYSGALRYVVEVWPQGFQMIATPSQLRQARPEKGPTPGHGTLDQLLAKAVAHFESLSPEEQASIRKAQTKSFDQAMPCTHGFSSFEDCPQCLDETLS